MARAEQLAMLHGTAFADAAVRIGSTTSTRARRRRLALRGECPLGAVTRQGRRRVWRSRLADEGWSSAHSSKVVTGSFGIVALTLTMRARAIARGATQG